MHDIILMAWFLWRQIDLYSLAFKWTCILDLLQGQFELVIHSHKKCHKVYFWGFVSTLYIKFFSIKILTYRFVTWHCVYIIITCEFKPCRLLIYRSFSLIRSGKTDKNKWYMIINISFSNLWLTAVDYCIKSFDHNYIFREA